MAENTFKSPGFFEREIELTAEKQQPSGVPAGIIGTAQMGPAFVPLTLGTFTDFENRFGSLDPKKFAPYAVREWLKHRQSVTFMRVLGAGANELESDFQKTERYGIVKNAGFHCKYEGSPVTDENNNSNYPGATQFLSAKHLITAKSDVGYPLFTDSETVRTSGDNASYEVSTTGNPTPISANDANLRETSSNPAVDDVLVICRAMILNTSGSYFQIKKHDDDYHPTDGFVRAVNGSNEIEMKLVLSDGTDLSWGNDDASTTAGGTSVPNREYTVSLDPDNTQYIGKVLNTDPAKFQEEGHLLYLDFAIEHELAPVLDSVDADNDEQDDAGDRNVDFNFAKLTVGHHTNKSSNTTYNSDTSNEKWIDTFGRFDCRYRAPKTTSFISQPFGGVEYDLFHFECLSDGEVANNEFKISIANIRKSANPNYEYGTFDVLVRKFDDNDFQPQVIERFVACNLDPDSESFVARKIGDKKAVFNFDANLPEERRLVISGRYANQSLNVRIVMNDSVYKEQVPKAALPFGFRGIPVIDINGHLLDSTSSAGHVPPLPFVFKATKGMLKTSSYAFQGEAGDNERADSRIYWGVKTTRIEDDSIVADAVYQSNISSRPNSLVKAYTKLQGVPGGTITDIGNLKIGNDADSFHNNKFTLARVAFGQRLDQLSGGLSDLGAASVEIKNACYIRNGSPDVTTYTITDGYDAATYDDRPTFASLVHDPVANNFNKFSSYAKFTNVFYGGFDGVNMLDPDIKELNDKASSTEGDGKAQLVTNGLGLTGTKVGDSTKMSGEGKDHNIISSYRQAIGIMTDSMSVRTNLLVIPGIRDEYITDHAANLTRDYGMSMYIMDIPNKDSSDTRVFGTSSRPDVENTSLALETRAFDNNYVASYFPDVYITDPVNNRRVLVPASVAALGALAYNDSVSYPWFAPAGFNRGALDFVENPQTRLSVSDRDDLYERRINPIANFPDGGFVIFGQKTMQQNQSSLDRVNVRRLMLEVKRQVAQVANTVLFEQNTPETRERFLGLIQPRLTQIQAQAGIEKFRIICDDTNNTPQDVEENRLNGKIVLIPTRTIEFIAIDFIVTSSGISFE